MPAGVLTARSVPNGPTKRSCPQAPLLMLSYLTTAIVTSSTSPTSVRIALWLKRPSSSALSSPNLFVALSVAVSLLQNTLPGPVFAEPTAFRGYSPQRAGTADPLRTSYRPRSFCHSKSPACILRVALLVLSLPVLLSKKACSPGSSPEPGRRHPSIFVLADHSPQDSSLSLGPDHPETPNTTTTTGSTTLSAAVDLDTLDQAPTSSSSTPAHLSSSREPSGIIQASQISRSNADLTSSSDTVSRSRRRRRRRRSDLSSSEPSDTASGLDDRSRGLYLSHEERQSAGPRRIHIPGRTDGRPPSPKRRRLANMRPEDASSTRTNGQSDTSNGLAISPRGKASTAGSLNGKASAHANGQSATNGSVKSPVLSPTYFGHDREEVTRILIQSLHDLGYSDAADSLSRESGYELESPAVAAFRSAVLAGQWAEAEHILLESFDTTDADDGPSPPAWGKLCLAESADRNEMLFLLRQQKFLEFLEARDLGAALMVLRQELTPLNHNIAQLHALSSLLMCPVEHLQEQAGWDGSIGSSRESLLTELSTFISPAVMIPDHRLAVLLDHVKQNQVNQCLYHNTAQVPSLYCDHVCDRNAFPRHATIQLTKHTDEVWYVEFSHDGTKLATASKDHSAIIYDTTDNFSIIHRLTEHENSVAYATWSPDDSKLITCSQDKKAKVWDVQTGRCLMTIEQHSEPVTAAAWAPDGESFVTASLDPKAQLCHWGLRSHRPLHVWTGGFRVQDCAITPDGSRLVAAEEIGKLHVYNFETHTEEYCLPLRSKATSVSASEDSKYILINMAEGQLHLVDLETTEVVRRFRGQKQGEFVIRGGFGGAAENFVVSGSEDSHVYIWHKENSTLVEVLEGHTKGCVNAVSWNPTNPSMFASAGDDYVVRVWTRESPSESSFGKNRLSASSGFTRTSALRSTSGLF